MATEKVSASTSEASSSLEEHSILLDNTSHPITSHKLGENNYLQWSHTVKLFISGKGKKEYLTGEINPPTSTDPKFKLWDRDNSAVMTWLINSMTPDISENFLLYESAHEIWAAAAKELYSKKENTSEIFEIESNLQDLKQGDFSVTQYFNRLSRLWQQLDSCEEITLKCSDDTRSFKEFLEKKRIFKFLMGLNEDLDAVSGRILGTKPLPSLKAAFSDIRLEESRKKVMMGGKVEKSSPLAISPLETTALVAQGIFKENMSSCGGPSKEHMFGSYG